MKKSVVIHINDGNPETLRNGERLLVERYYKTEEIIEQYLSEGFEVKHIIPDYTPAPADADIAFYKTGIIVYLEKEE